MFYERGPLTLIADDQFPVAGPRPRFEALAAAEGAALAGAEGTLGAELATMASGADAGAVDQAGLDLGAAAEELDRQSRAHDTAIGDVAAGADALELTLTGLTGELPGDFVAPPQPPPERDAHTGLPPDVPLPPDRDAPARGGPRGPGRRPPEPAPPDETPPAAEDAAPPPPAEEPPRDEGGDSGPITV